MPESSARRLKDMITDMKKLFLIVLPLVAFCHASAAQEVSISTNAVDYANLGTLNVEASYALARHWCMTAGLKYNPFTWRADNESGIMQNRQAVYAAGVRYWPWHVYSGWWMAAKGQYQLYNIGGISSLETQEGDRFGAGVAAGYSYMLHKHLNLELGVGAWGGLDRFTLYSCPRCGRVVREGDDFFFMLNDVLLSVTYVF